VTPTLSDEEPPILIDEAVVENELAEVGLVIVMLGAVPSVRVTVSVSVAVLPAASLAVTTIALLPICSDTDDTLQDVVPLALVEPPPFTR
jgi:hypothetical protein